MAVVGRGSDKSDFEGLPQLSGEFFNLCVNIDIGPDPVNVDACVCVCVCVTQLMRRNAISALNPLWRGARRSAG